MLANPLPADTASTSPSNFLNPSPATTMSVDISPVIQINGANPATIQVGATYNDLGATITGPQADLNFAA